MFTFVNKERDMIPFNDSYNTIKNNRLLGRYITNKDIIPELEKLKDWDVEEIGRSTLNNPIHSVTMGEGPIKILAWSQMHGNESTTTKAVFDLFNLFSKVSDPKVRFVLKKCTLKIIPILNPDGAQRYTRENVNSIDLNRDAKDLKELESQVLRRAYESFQPHFCLNLHDQRTIFSAGDTNKPATLSFLAPAKDEARTINETRRTSMQIIAAMNESLQDLIPGQVGRYDDGYNANCTGDYFQQHVPTILFEAGHFPGDYQREETRKFLFHALWSALWIICRDDYKGFSIDEYSKIPENKKNFVDVLLRNAEISGKVVDLGIIFDEKIRSGKIAFDPKVVFIDANLPLFGHQEIDCEGKNLTHLSGKEISENDLVGGFLLKGKKLSIKRE